MSLPIDATITSVWPHIANQRHYIRKVRDAMIDCLKEHGTAHVKIGITGSGQKPCYRIFAKSVSGEETIYGSYWGETGNPIENPQALTENWSSSSMSFDEIDSFAQEKFGVKPKPKP